MAVDLGNHLAAASADRTPLWIDAWQYGEKLLNKGEPAPWNDVGQLVSFIGRLQGLVASDVLMLEVPRFYDYWLQRSPQLLAAMAEKRRLGYALRTLLADHSARAQLHECIAAVCHTYSNLPVILAMPSPRQWVALAHCQSGGLESVDVSWEEAESAAMYLADYLRTFADCELSGVLLRESPGRGPVDASEAARYQPVVNVARHYQWSVVLDDVEDSGAVACGSEDILFLGADIAGLSGVRVTEMEGPGEVSRFGQTRRCYCYVHIPDSAVPEAVLDLLDSLRKSG